jgi:hypothetical protein
MFHRRRKPLLTRRFLCTKSLIRKKQLERALFEGQNEEIKASYRVLRVIIALFVPAGAVFSYFFPLPAVFIMPLLAGAAFFTLFYTPRLRLERELRKKLSFAPAASLAAGFGLGILLRGLF